MRCLPEPTPSAVERVPNPDFEARSPLFFESYQNQAFELGLNWASGLVCETQTKAVEAGWNLEVTWTRQNREQTVQAYSARAVAAPVVAAPVVGTDSPIVGSIRAGIPKRRFS